MLTKLERFGDGLMLRLPPELVADARLVEGQPVEFEIVAGKLVIRPDPDAARHLDELLSRITPENRHGETDWGPPVGREVW